MALLPDLGCFSKNPRDPLIRPILKVSDRSAKRSEIVISLHDQGNRLSRGHSSRAFLEKSRYNNYLECLIPMCVSKAPEEAIISFTRRRFVDPPSNIIAGRSIRSLPEKAIRALGVFTLPYTHRHARLVSCATGYRIARLSIRASDRRFRSPEALGCQGLPAGNAIIAADDPLFLRSREQAARSFVDAAFIEHGRLFPLPYHARGD